MPVLARWMAGAHSTRGAAHERDGLPNQDAFAVTHAPAVTVAVADGHGSPRCTRSDIGAAIAVSVACDVIPPYVEDPRDLASLRASIADELVRAWRTRVVAHLAERPIGAAEAERVDGPPIHAYGATLVAVAADGDALLAVQIGDGEVWLANAERTERLVPRDLRFALNGTASLCQDDATGEVRIARARVAAPALAVVATDGFARPLTSDREMAAVVARLHERAGSAGFEATLAALPPELAGASAYGGDDVTVGIIYRA